MKIELLKVTGQASASAAGTVVCELEPGYRYHSLLMFLASASSVLTVNYPNAARLRVNGTVQREISLTDLNLINGLNNPPSATFGTAAATPYLSYVPAAARTFLEHYFTEPWNPQFDARQRYALDLLPSDTATIEIPFASVTPAPVVSFFAEVEPLGLLAVSGRGVNRENGRPTLVKMIQGSESTGAALINITKINKTFSRADSVQALRLKDADQAISAVEITVNDKSVYKRTKEANDKELRSYGLNPVSGYFDIVPNASDDPRDGFIWTPADKINVAVTLAASATTVIAWTLQRFGQAD